MSVHTPVPRAVVFCGQVAPPVATSAKRPAACRAARLVSNWYGPAPSTVNSMAAAGEPLGVGEAPGLGDAVEPEVAGAVVGVCATAGALARQPPTAKRAATRRTRPVRLMIPSAADAGEGRKSGLRQITMAA